MALIPPFFFDCVVAIGKQNPDGSKLWIGTGFLFGKFIQQRPDNQKEYKVYLVTNKHVLKNQTDIILRFNPQDDKPATDYPFKLIDKDSKNLWTGHPKDSIDVAVLAINAKHLQNEGMKFAFFESDAMVFTVDKLKEMETTEGDYIFVLGFPMGLVAVDRQHVILRSGAIARIRDLFEGRSTDFIVDALVFPGNSGGPVVVKPELVSIQGTKSNMNAGLIGVVKSYIPYQDVALSQQTGRPRIIFEDNSGLSLVEPADYIIQTIDEDEKLKPQPPTTTA
jgi:S1-C subfamily serine protease